MASLRGKAPHETWKELLRVDNDPTRNQGIAATLQRVTDGNGDYTALAISNSAVKVWGSLGATEAINSGGNITGLTLVGTGLNVGNSGQAATASINTTGAIVGTSLNVGIGSVTAGAITGAAITGTSLSAGASGTVTGGTFTGNAATVTNGVYTTSIINIGTTAVALNRASNPQTLTGVNIDGNAGTVTSGVYTTSLFNLGTTSVALNRASAQQTLYGVSIDGNAGSATTAGSSGTWTAGVTTPGSYTYGNAAGSSTYYKVGKVVKGSFILQFRHTTAVPTATTAFTVGGLPFVAANTFGYVNITYTDFTVVPFVRIANGTTTMTFHTSVKSATSDYPYSSTGHPNTASPTLNKTIQGFFIYEATT